MLGLETPVTCFHFVFQKEIINMTQKDTMNIKPTLIKYDKQSIKKIKQNNNNKYTFTSKTDIIKCVLHIKKRNRTEKM